MAEINSYAFSYKDVATALLKEQNIHEGFWTVSLTLGFGVSAMGKPEAPTELRPGAVILIESIGLQRATEKSNNLTFDAAEVNPVRVAAPKKS
ncbi:MAG: hypothetical protein ACYCZD_06870 [Rhodanobacter sp.]